MAVFKLFWSSILTLLVLILDIVWRSLASACKGITDASVSIVTFLIFGLAGGGIVCGIYLLVHSFTGHSMAFLNAVFVIVVGGVLVSLVAFLATLLGSILEVLLNLIVWALELIERYIERAHNFCLLFVDKQLKKC